MTTTATYAPALLTVCPGCRFDVEAVMDHAPSSLSRNGMHHPLGHDGRMPWKAADLFAALGIATTVSLAVVAPAHEACNVCGDASRTLLGYAAHPAAGRGRWV